MADYLDSDGALIDTAEYGDLALELARRLNPARKELNKTSRHPERTSSMNANPYSNYSVPNSSPQQPLWKKALAFISLGFGALMILMGPASQSVLFGIFAGLAIALPGAWWLIHDRREKKGAHPLKRHWGIIAIVSIMMFFIGVVFLPETESSGEESDPASSSSSSAPSSSVEETTSEETTTSEEPTTTTSETPTTESTEPSTEPEQPTSEHQEVPTPDNDDDDVDHHHAPPARQIAPARPQPAPAPAPAQYFSNCAEAKSAGAAPLYADSPGYRSGLDRDGDGVACEK